MGEIIDVSDDETSCPGKSPLRLTNALESNIIGELTEGLDKPNVLRASSFKEEETQTESDENELLAEIERLKASNELLKNSENNENELLAEIRRLKASNKLLKNMYCEMAENVQKVSTALKNEKLDDESGKILAQVEGIKKIDQVGKIHDPGEWAEAVSKFLILTKDKGLNCKEVTSWMINLLKIVNRSSNEAYTASWSKCAEELLKRSWEKHNFEDKSENEKVKKWLKDCVKAVEKLQFIIKRFKLIDYTPNATSKLGQSTIAQALATICKAEKVVTENIGSKMKDLGRFSCYIEELIIEFGGRIDGQEDVDISEFMSGIEGIIDEEKLASRFRVKKD